MTITTNSEPETKKHAFDLAHQLTGGVVVCLHGDLGAGKTTFVKGLAEGLGVTNTITSPTFTLMNIYNTRAQEHKNIKTLVHIDTYRLKDEQELIGTGALDYIGEPDTISVIEWPEKIAKLLTNKKVQNIYFEHGPNNTRTIQINPV